MDRPQAGGYNTYETALEKFPWQFDCSAQEAQVIVPRNFDAAKLLQMRGKPLRV
jgi:hypothetical protein